MLPNTRRPSATASRPTSSARAYFFPTPSTAARSAIALNRVRVLGPKYPASPIKYSLSPNLRRHKKEMDLIDRYIAEVRWYLPPEQRDAVGVALADELRTL